MGGAQTYGEGAQEVPRPIAGMSRLMGRCLWGCPGTQGGSLGCPGPWECPDCWGRRLRRCPDPWGAAQAHKVGALGLPRLIREGTLGMPRPMEGPVPRPMGCVQAHRGSLGPWGVPRPMEDT